MKDCPKFLLLLAITSLMMFSQEGLSQPVPAEQENIPYLVTFGPQAAQSWGDDDYSQTFFFKIDIEYTSPFYIKIWDPECGGEHDELNGEFDTRTTFEVFGGPGCYSDLDAQETDPSGNYKSGNLMAFKSFAVDVNCCIELDCSSVAAATSSLAALYSSD